MNITDSRMTVLFKTQKQIFIKQFANNFHYSLFLPYFILFFYITKKLLLTISVIQMSLFKCPKAISLTSQGEKHQPLVYKVCSQLHFIVTTLAR